MAESRRPTSTLCLLSFLVSLRLSLKFVIQMKNQCDLLLFLIYFSKSDVVGPWSGVMNDGGDIC